MRAILFSSAWTFFTRVRELTIGKICKIIALIFISSAWKSKNDKWLYSKFSKVFFMITTKNGLSHSALDNEAPRCTLLIGKSRNCKRFSIELLAQKLCQLSQFMLTTSSTRFINFYSSESCHVFAFSIY